MQTKNYFFVTIVVIAVIIICTIIIIGCSKKEVRVGPCDSEKGFFEAVESNNFDNCMNVHEPYCQDYCRFKIAAYSDNPDNCEKINNLKRKDLCYQYLAILLEDISLCTKQSESNALQSKSLCETQYYRKYGYPTK